MARPGAIISAIKAAPGRNFGAPQAAGMISSAPPLRKCSLQAQLLAAYGQFLPGPARYSRTVRSLLPARFIPFPLTSLSILRDAGSRGGGNTGPAGTCLRPLVPKA